MSITPGSQAISTRRARKSIAAMPSMGSGFDLENSTVQGIGGIEALRKTISKKSRSKSIGPGGLEALNETTGNAQKIIPRSILKPSIPLSPLRPIPSHSNLRKNSPLKTRGGASPMRSSPRKLNSITGQSGLDKVPNPFDESTKQSQPAGDSTRIGLKSEEQQQAEAREREKREAIERRDARRKSLANRRVSFAPEATLHTWNVVELPDDATSSSEATNSTRRASSASSLGQAFGSDNTETPSTPPKEEIQVAASPGDQHQDFSSSPMSSGDDQSMEIEEIIDASDSDSDKDIIEQEETINDIDDTTRSIYEQESNENPDANAESSEALDEALRQASMYAGSQNTKTVDADGDISMDIANDEVTYAFQPWIQKDISKPNLARGFSSQQDQENMNPFSEPSPGPIEATEDDDEMTMDVTQAVGGILASQTQSAAKKRRVSLAPNKRRSSMGHRRSSIKQGDLDDETMELTTAIGGIQEDQAAPEDNTGSVDENEDMSMEFTSVFGGVVNRAKGAAVLDRDSASLVNQQHGSVQDQQNDEGMDMTVAMGGILSPVAERTEPVEDNTMGMDFTAAVGSILPTDLNTGNRVQARALMEEEADHGQLTKSPFLRQTSQDVLKTVTPTQTAVTASESGSPSVVNTQTRSTRRSLQARQSTTPKGSPRRTTPLKKPTTPAKQITPQTQPPRPTTPSKTPPAKNVAMRRTSPKKLFKEEIKKQAASPKPVFSEDATTPKNSIDQAKQPLLQFNEDATTGLSLPSVVLTPKARRPSGIGIDQVGMGSPRAAAKLDRRSSLGEQALSFTPQKGQSPAVRFADPRALEQEIDNERAEDQRRESGRGIMQMEADAAQEEDKDTTTNLRDMINSMTPKKNKLKGRKSLAVGGARGLLGKRPIELDDDEEEDEATPKKLKGADRSPVKSIRLPPPPSKDETTGRLGAAPRFSLGVTSGNVTTPTTQVFSPEKAKATTPKDHGRFKDTEVVKSSSKPPNSFNDQKNGAPVDPEPEVEDDRVHLQEFLNMTSIRFMELNTTKRRHTIAPTKANDEDSTREIGEQAKEGDDRRLSACVVASASTIPMLELYQHSCRELKKYISEGRSIVREIEADTFEDNPPLFREYMTAPPQVKSIMDIQFKNIKTHARLLSKGMWYEWRMKLLEGLKEGLLHIGNNLVTDADVLAAQEAVIDSILPRLLAQHEKLSLETTMLQEQADALADCDQDELRSTRESLVSTEDDIESKRAQIAALQSELAQQEAAIEVAAGRKQTCLSEIAEAERIREECRGWDPAEVAALRASVDTLEKETGWVVVTAHESTLTMTYHRELSLYVTPAAFAPHANEKSSNAAISLTFEAKDEPTTTQRFFLQLLRARLLAVYQPQTRLEDVIKLVSAGWDLARKVGGQVGALTAAWQTEEAIMGDDKLRITAFMLLRTMRTKVDVGFEVAVGGVASEVTPSVGVSAKVVYGEELKEGKMDDFLEKRTDGVDGWAEAVGELESRLKARGKKDKA